MLYRLLLLCFPRDFRLRHGAAMRAQFDAQRRALRGRPLASLALWVRAAGDAIRHGAAARFGAFRPPIAPAARIADRAGWLADLRLALRLLWRQPGFSLVACLTLGLGIGASTAVFSVIDASLFKPLPYRAPQQLMSIYLGTTTVSGDEVFVVTSGNYAERLRNIPGVFESLGAYGHARPVALADGNGPPLQLGGLTPEFPDLIGVRPQVGRVFGPADIGSDAIVISDEYWRKEFGRSLDAIGATVALTRGTVTIVGVMPRHFRYLIGAETDAWAPISEADGSEVVGRLREGLTVTQARLQLDAYLANPDSPWRPRAIDIRPIDWNRGDATVRRMLYLLLGAVSCLLLIACSNVANMLLSRGVSRRREVAVRSALGASRARLVRMFLAEGLVISAAGGVAAAVVAWLGIRILPDLVPAELVDTILGVTPPALDSRIFVAGLAATLLSGALCSAWPAVRTVRSGGLAGAVSAQRGAGHTPGQRRASAAFQTVQVALTVVLLFGASLLVAAFTRMASTPMGFDADNLGVLTVELPDDLERPVERAYMDELVARVAATPGVRSALMGYSPVSAGLGGNFMVAGAADAGPRVEGFYLGLDYIRMTGMEVVAGRPFEAADLAITDSVALIDDRTARRFWPGDSAIGKQFRLYDGENGTLTVIGVVQRTPTIWMGRDTALVYRLASERLVLPNVLFRIEDDPARTLAGVAATVRGFGRGVYSRRLGLVTDLFAEFDPTGPSRFYSMLMTLFAVLGLTTAMVGLFGLLTHSVNRRVRDIGVRMALGASAGRIGRHVLAEALLPVALGLIAGLVASAWVGQALAAQLPFVQARDPLAIVAVPLILLTVAAGAAFVPVRRALRIDPAVALRTE